MAENENPFLFYTERRLVALTGRKARTAEELLTHLMEVSGSSIFYHTHYLYLIHHFRKPQFYNDFANWAAQALQENRFAERMAAVDPLASPSLRHLRECMAEVVRQHVQDPGTKPRECPPGEEFHFCEAHSFIMPTGHSASTPAEFFKQLEEVSPACLHFHFFEARLRLEGVTNDFSKWLNERGEEQLAHDIDAINPYVMSLDELKTEIIRLGKRRFRS